VWRWLAHLHVVSTPHAKEAQQAFPVSAAGFRLGADIADKQVAACLQESGSPPSFEDGDPLSLPLPFCSC